MGDHSEKKASPIWHSDIPGMLALIIQPLVAILIVMFIPFVLELRHHHAVPVYVCAVVSGFIGVALLFFARLPLYRERRFFTFGSRHLDVAHRRLYKLAYGFVGIAVFLLLALVLAVGL